MMLELVDRLDEVTSNCAVMSSYLASSDPDDSHFVRERIASGKCFMAIDVVGETYFFPSRFVGYKDNSRIKHENGDNKDGRLTNVAIEKLIAGSTLEASEALEEVFLHFCQRKNIVPFKVKRKYWNLRALHIDLGNDIRAFSEGLAAQKEITVFKRCAKLVAEVKAEREPICECCGFDFKRIYGNIGDGYTECHHMDPLYKRAGKNLPTSKDEVALLCANCHRMVHRTRDGYTIAEVKAEMERAKRSRAHEKARR